MLAVFLGVVLLLVGFVLALPLFGFGRFWPGVGDLADLVFSLLFGVLGIALIAANVGVMWVFGPAFVLGAAILWLLLAAVRLSIMYIRKKKAAIEQN